MATGAGATAAALVAASVVGFLVIGVASGPVDWWRLVTSAVWDPARADFGGASMLWGTAAVSLLALLLAAPVGWGAAIAISELVPRRWRRELQAGAEVLAVVPSIVYGLVGVVYIRPLVAKVAGVPGGDSLVAAAVVLAVMVLPTIVAVSVDALVAVPVSVREAAAASGLTRTEVIRSAVVPQARRGMGAAVLLGLARAMGETIAVFLLVGRADGRLPSSVGDALDALVRPGQTITTKLNGPESLLAGTSGAHWAALCALALILVAAVAALTLVRRTAPDGARTRGRTLRGARIGRGGRDRAARVLYAMALAIPLALVIAVVAAVVARGTLVFSPGFWTTPSLGASGGGVRNQIVGTLLLVAAAGVLAAPVGMALGLAGSELRRPRLAGGVRALTAGLAGIPSIVLGLWGYWLFSTRFGWGKSWLAGAVALAVIAIPPVAVAVTAAAASVPTERREAASAAGLRPDQVVRSVVVPHAAPGLVTGLLLGLARAAGETAPLLFTAAVFAGAPTFPSGVQQSPVVALPTHVFTLAQDAADPAALRAAWGAAAVLVVLAGLLVLAAIPARRRMEARAR